MTVAPAGSVVVHKLNRELFIKWTEGILLERDRAGKCTVLDGSDFNEKCEAALKALEEGHTVFLTERSGMPVTRLSLKDGAYVEELV